MDAARRRDPEERAAYLDVVCAGKPELRAAVLARFDEEFRTVEPQRAAAAASSIDTALWSAEAAASTVGPPRPP